MINIAPKVAAVFYLLWGIIHVAGGLVMLDASYNGPNVFIQMLSGNEISNGSQSENLTTENQLASSNVFSFHSFNIIWMGILSGLIAVRMNWNNSRAGYWCNLGIVGFADLGLILFMVVPGVMKITDAWIGPVLFILAITFSTMARLSVRKQMRV